MSEIISILISNIFNDLPFDFLSSNFYFSHTWFDYLKISII